MLIHYTKVLSIRHSYPAIARGNYQALYAGKSTFGGFFVTYGNDKLVILHNTSADETVTFDISTLKNGSNKTLGQLMNLSSIELGDYVGVSDAELSGTTLTLGPQTTVILYQYTE